MQASSPFLSRRTWRARSVVSQPLTFSAVQTWPTGHVIGMYQPRSVDPIAVTSWWNIVSYLSRSLHQELWLKICGKYLIRIND